MQIRCDIWWMLSRCIPLRSVRAAVRRPRQAKVRRLADQPRSAALKTALVGLSHRPARPPPPAVSRTLAAAARQGRRRWRLRLLRLRRLRRLLRRLQLKSGVALQTLRGEARRACESPSCQKKRRHVYRQTCFMQPNQHIRHSEYETDYRYPVTQQLP